MSGTKAALRYAKAILNFAVEQHKEDDINNDMLLIVNTLEESKELQLMLKNPILKTNLKKETIKTIFSSNVSPLTISSINLLIDNNRLDILNEVAEKYTIIYDELKGKEIAKITTAIPLNSELNNQVLDKVKEITGKKASIENIINPDILGGFILRIGDIQYDASIANKLQSLKRQFEN
ncbi:MAG: ATP synthase F1 subunit delta [Lutibacter sp.]|jgi:F-type H+-transporting ATPase subunit delta|uniref:ATP synthase F1 subunit delta n=1 Tax=Lutibacter sp. TaxID=1925666 RepID=UPI00299F4CC4|nr:ATP synthase F1 subunit delta [Lutibacter sp.]MDX1829638.1 ATP synthase F1 subunit delta [Lutibacter sp.]